MQLFKVLIILSLFMGHSNLRPTDWTNVQVSSFFSASRNRMIDFAIFTPPGYENSNQSYPVLYFLHGRGGGYLLYWVALSAEVPQANGDAGAWISQLIEEGIIPPIIIVTPDDEDGEWDETNETMITEELTAYIDSNWRTIPDRGARAIEGFSMGAMGASRYASRHSDLYCSTIIMADPGVQPLIQYWEANQADILSNQLGVRLVVGEDDEQRIPYMAQFDDALSNLGIPREFEIVPGAGHHVGEIYRGAGVKGLKFHANCFEEIGPPVPGPDDQKNKIFIPYIRKRYTPIDVQSIFRISIGNS